MHPAPESLLSDQCTAGILRAAWPESDWVRKLWAHRVDTASHSQLPARSQHHMFEASRAAPVPGRQQPTAWPKQGCWGSAAEAGRQPPVLHASRSPARYAWYESHSAAVRPHYGVCQAPHVQCKARSCMISTWVARSIQELSTRQSRHAGPEHGLLQGLLTQPAKPALLLERLLPRTPATHSAACLSSILRRTCQAAGPLEHWQGITSVSDAAAEKAARCFRAVSGRPPCMRICASSRASSRLRAALRTEPLASAHRLLASLISGSRSCQTQPAAQYWLCAEC